MTPDEYTIEELTLDVGDGHQLYVQDWGNKDAELPIVFLHGGPGSGCNDGHKDYFNPKQQRVVFHDQRGAGKSEPAGSLDNNTTQHLIDDIEKIADKLGLDKFIITGGSWGSCLALAYALSHSDRVKGIVVHGVFTGSSDEIEWLGQGRFRDFFPDAWQRYLEATPQDHRANPSAYHFKRALSDKQDEAKASAYAYEMLELSLLKLNDKFTPPSYETYDPAKIRTEIHYVSQVSFLPDNYILDNASILSMPVWIVQGRYDMVCRPAAAYKLNQALPNSRLIWTTNGHLAEHEAKNILGLAYQYLAGDL